MLTEGCKREKHEREGDQGVRNEERERENEREKREEGKRERERKRFKK